MNFTVNYNPTWDSEGYYITQNIRLDCTEVELAYINSRVHKAMDAEGKGIMWIRIWQGRQRIGLSILAALNETVCKDIKRVKNDRNTMLTVHITKPRPRNAEGACVTCRYSSVNLERCTLHGVEIYQPDMGCNEWER